MNKIREQYQSIEKRPFLIGWPFSLMVLVIVSLMCLGFASAELHRFHVSICEITRKPDARYEISMKAFTHDLEDEISLAMKKNLYLATAKEDKNTQEILSDYLTDQLKLTEDGKRVSLKLIGFEHEEEATWLYLEGTGDANAKTLEVQNGFCQLYFDDQTNIIQFKLGNKKHISALLNRANTKAVFTLQ